MRFLLRIFVLFVAVYTVLGIVRGVFTGLTSGRTAPALSGRLVKDPVCLTYIPVETALQAKDQFFCSEQCRSKFLSA